MKSKLVKSALTRKMSHWLKSIDEQEVGLLKAGFNTDEIAKLKNIIETKTIITGGAIASLLLNEKVNDYDVYFKDMESARFAAEFYVKWFNYLNPECGIKPAVSFNNDDLYGENENRVRIIVKSAGFAGEDNPVEGAITDYHYFEGDPDGDHAENYLLQYSRFKEQKTEADRPAYRPIFMSNNAIMLSDDVQVIIRFYGSPDEIHKNFDFVHATNWYVYNDEETKRPKLELKKEALEALLNRELVFLNSKYPICALFRLRKFVKQGFKFPNAGQIFKIAWQINKLDLTNYDVLYDQLTGVDAAYFMEVLQLLKKKADESESKQIDETYLFQLIDMIF